MVERRSPPGGRRSTRVGEAAASSGSWRGRGDERAAGGLRQATPAHDRGPAHAGDLRGLRVDGGRDGDAHRGHRTRRPRLYGWPFSAYLVASVFGMVVGGDLDDRRGSRAALLAGVTIFAARLLGGGLSGHMAVFVGARAVQGVGGGIIAVSLYVVAGRAYGPDLRPRLFAAFSAAWVLPALVGPVLAGLITTHLGWRWVFLGM